MRLYSDLNQHLLKNGHVLLEKWGFEVGNFNSNGQMYVVKNPKRRDNNFGSFFINKQTGVWEDFSTGEKGGDLIDLYCWRYDLTIGQALEYLKEKYSFIADTGKGYFYGNISNNDDISSPIPRDKFPNKSDLHHKSKEGVSLGDPDEIYPYYTENGQIYGVICRFNTSKGKEIRPLTWRRWERGPLKGQGMWRYKGFGERRPLFNLPAILSTHHSIVLCEGEKAAVAAEQLFDDFIGTCWSGGVNAYHKTNFSHLKDRTVFLWPDFDSQGVAAMMHVGEILKKNNCKIRFIIPPRNTKKGSDAADFTFIPRNIVVSPPKWIKNLEK